MMRTTEAPITTDALADLEAVLRHMDRGGVQDPELLQRIADRSRAIRARVLEEHGVLDVAVGLVRETRDE